MFYMQLPVLGHSTVDRRGRGLETNHVCRTLLVCRKHRSKREVITILPQNKNCVPAREYGFLVQVYICTVQWKVVLRLHFRVSDVELFVNNK